MTTILPAGLTPYKQPEIHKLPKNFGRPGPITIGLIGAGGGGSEMLTRLVEMDHAFAALGLPRLAVTVYDPETVSASNPGRQRFYKSDVGHHKAVLLVHRANAAFGLQWTAVAEAYTGQSAASPAAYQPPRPFDVLITCVDTARARREIHAACTGEGAGRARYEDSQYWDNGGSPAYWLDIGNSRTRGQCVLGQFGRPGRLDTKRLPHVMDLYPGTYAADADEDNDPSCSLAQSLLVQDLYVSKFVALRAADLLWRLLREREIDCHGWWVNLREGDKPMPVQPVPTRLSATVETRLSATVDLSTPLDLSARATTDLRAKALGEAA